MKIRFEQDLKNVIKSKKAKFKYEFRRLAVLDYENIKDIPLPNCDYIKNYSMCEVNKKTECQ